MTETQKTPEAPKRITWGKRRNGNTAEGRAGTIRLFVYTWDGSSQHPGKPWVPRPKLALSQLRRAAALVAEFEAERSGGQP